MLSRMIAPIHSYFHCRYFLKALLVHKCKLVIKLQMLPLRRPCFYLLFLVLCYLSLSSYTRTQVDIFHIHKWTFFTLPYSVHFRSVFVFPAPVHVSSLFSFPRLCTYYPPEHKFKRSLSLSLSVTHLSLCGNCDGIVYFVHFRLALVLSAPTTSFVPLHTFMHILHA